MSDLHPRPYIYTMIYSLNSVNTVRGNPNAFTRRRRRIGVRIGVRISQNQKKKPKKKPCQNRSQNQSQNHKKKNQKKKNHKKKKKLGKGEWRMRSILLERR